MNQILGTTPDQHGTTDGDLEPKSCQYSPDREVKCHETDCRSCLKAKAFNPNLCVTCGKDAYEEFQRTGKPHICRK